jgi:16S rRNA processing protein RimM
VTGRATPDDDLILGRVAGPRGVRGELKVTLRGVDPHWAADLRQVILGEAAIAFRVIGARFFNGHLLLRLEGIEDRNEAEVWRGALVSVTRDAAPRLGPGEYYARDIVGVRVVTEAGEVLGQLAEVLATGANDVYVVRGDEGELLLPAIADVVRSVDLDGGVMTVRLLEGLR